MTGYRVTLKNTTDDDSVTIATDPVLLSPDTIQYNFTNVSQGRLYTVTVIAVNGVGDSTPTIRTISKYIVIIIPSIAFVLLLLLIDDLNMLMLCCVICVVISLINFVIVLFQMLEYYLLNKFMLF